MRSRTLAQMGLWPDPAKLFLCSYTHAFLSWYRQFSYTALHYTTIQGVRIGTLLPAVNQKEITLNRLTLGFFFLLGSSAVLCDGHFADQIMANVSIRNRAVSSSPARSGAKNDLHVCLLQATFI